MPVGIFNEASVDNLPAINNECISLTFSLDKLFALNPALLDIHEIQKHSACRPAKKMSDMSKIAMVELDTYSPNKNAKGMLSLLSEACMIAEETNGPIYASQFRSV